LLGEVFQHSRFSDACVASNFHIATRIKSRANGRDPFMTRQQRPANAVVNVGKSISGRFGEGCARGEVMPVRRKAEGFLLEILN
jgi:hypothetical protein